MIGCQINLVWHSMMFPSDSVRIIWNSNVLREKRCLPSMTVLCTEGPIQNCFWVDRFKLLTDFHNSCRTFYDKLSCSIVQRKYFV